jgi:hypothetical protein
MTDNGRKFKKLFHHFKANTADIHPEVRRYKDGGVIAFGGELSYEPYDDNITVRVLLLKRYNCKNGIKGS